MTTTIFKRHKKGAGMPLNALAPAIILLVTVTIILTIGSQIGQQIVANNCPSNCTYVESYQDCKNWNGTHWLACPTGDSIVYNISEEGMNSSLEVAKWMDVMGVVLGASVVIGMVYFLMKK